MSIKKLRSTKFLPLILSLILFLGLFPAKVFAEGNNNGLTSVTIKNTSNGSISACLEGDTLQAELNPSATAAKVTWYVTKNFSTGPSDIEIISGSDLTLKTTNDQYGGWIFCKVTDAADPTNVIQSNKIYYYWDKTIPAEEFKVGDILPANQMVTMATLLGLGYDNVGGYNYESSCYEFWSPSSGMNIYFNVDTIVLEIAKYPAENGGWQGDELNKHGNPVHGTSVYIINCVPYVPYNVEHSLHNITASDNTAGDNKAVNRVDYTTTLKVTEGYHLPNTITVMIGDKTAVADTDYKYNKSTGEITIFGDKIIGNISIKAEAHAPTWDEGTVTNAPTTTSEGIKTFTCTTCGVTKTEAIPKLINHTIIEGANETIEQGKPVIFRSDAAFKDFLKVLIDNKEVPNDMYTVTEGSTIITIKSEFLKTLAIGKHTINIVSTTGEAKTEFTLTAASNVPPQTGDNGNNPDINSPQTGDNTNLILWITLLIVSAVGGLILLEKRKKLIK